MSDFKYNTNVAYYLRNGWKLVSPQKCTCPVCGAALIQNVLYDFMFCVPCQAKIVTQSDGSRYTINQEQEQKLSNKF